jgi:hypothetical protein
LLASAKKMVTLGQLQTVGKFDFTLPDIAEQPWTEFKLAVNKRIATRRLSFNRDAPITQF